MNFKPMKWFLSTTTLALVFSANPAFASTLKCANQGTQMQISEISKDRSALSVTTIKNNVSESLLADFMMAHEGTHSYENGIANQNVLNSGYTTPYGNWRLLPDVRVRVIRHSDSLASKDLNQMRVHLNIQSKTESLNMEFSECVETKD